MRRNPSKPSGIKENILLMVQKSSVHHLSLVVAPTGWKIHHFQAEIYANRLIIQVHYLGVKTQHFLRVPWLMRWSNPGQIEIRLDFQTVIRVDGSEIPNNHLGCMKHYETLQIMGILTISTGEFAGFLNHQQYLSKNLFMKRFLLPHLGDGFKSQNS